MRDTLFLLAVLAWTALPHWFSLPLWCSLLSASLLGWRALLAWRSARLPKRSVLIVLLLISVGLTYRSFGAIFGREPGIALLIMLVSLKTLELRARRDAFVVFFLGFFLVLTHFLSSQSLPVAAAMLVSVWGLLTSLTLAHMPVGKAPLKQASAVALRAAAWGTPVMLLLFLLFPRMGPLWGVPQADRSSTGLSTVMSIGSIAQLVQDESVAMRVRFQGPAPPPQAMYFRGPVLSRFDGNEWLPLRESFPIGEPELLSIRGAGVAYEVTLEPNQLPLLPLLDATPSISGLQGLMAKRRDNLSWATHRPVTERLRLQATAFPQFSLGPLNAVPSLAFDRQLPDGFNPRLLAWARQLRSAQPPEVQANAEALADALLAHIRSAGFSYTLTPGIYGEDDPFGALDEFWLDRRAGFCEHFAAGFVVAMRAMGIPARVVTGYQGSDPEPFDGYYLVRQSHAHAWAEFWQAGRGWLRADPTNAVAPDRIQHSRRLRPPPGAIDNALNAVDPQLLARLRAAWEGVNNRWNQWVLNYARGQQFDLLQRLGFEAPSWQDLAKLLVGSLALASLFGAGWAFWDRQRMAPWVRQRQAVSASLRRLGLAAAEHEAPRSLALQLRQRFGAQAEALAALLEALDRQRYGPPRAHAGASGAAWLRQLRREARRLEVELAS